VRCLTDGAETVLGTRREADLVLWERLSSIKTGGYVAGRSNISCLKRMLDRTQARCLPRPYVGSNPTLGTKAPKPGLWTSKLRP